LSGIIEIVFQPDSPLAMTAIGSEKTDYGGIKLRVNVQNLSDKTIKAYTLSRNFQGPEAKNLKTFFTPLGSGQTA